jgi:hypothetical protein
MHIAGDSVISYRFLAGMLLITMHSLPALFIIKLQEYWNNKLRFIAISIIFASAFPGFFILSWDVFLWFFLSLIYITGYFFIRKGGLSYILVMGLLTGIIIAVRFPSITVTVPILFIVITQPLISKHYFSKLLSNIFAYLISAGS